MAQDSRNDRLKSSFRNITQLEANELRDYIRESAPPAILTHHPDDKNECAALRMVMAASDYIGDIQLSPDPLMRAGHVKCVWYESVVSRDEKGERVVHHNKKEATTQYARRNPETEDVYSALVN